MRLENWKRINYGDCYALTGQIYGDTRGQFFDGEIATTSVVREITEDGRALTLNSEYVLGVEAP